MLTGTITFEVTIKGQKTEEQVDQLSKAVEKAIEAVTGVDSADEVEQNIGEGDDD